MTLLKGSDQNSREINVALLSLEADIKNKITNFDTSVIDKQLAEINSRIDKINAGGNNTSAQINDIRYEIEDINSKLNGNSAKIKNIEQKLSDIFSADNKVTDFNTTTNSGIYYWVTDAANRPSDYGVLLVNKHDGGSTTSLWINQIAYGTNSKIYFRQNINSGNWTEWKAVAFDGEITAKKVANALTVNDKTYDGSEAVDAGVQTVANGGTGVTTQADINKAFIGNLDVGESDVTDGTEFVSSYASDSGFSSTDEGSLHKPYKRQFVKVWNYIKGKISSVLGLSTDGLSSKGNITVPDNKYIRAICASNDYVQIMGSGTGDSGSGEISTGDNGNEPLYARQRDTSNNVTHEITLLDASGNQKFNTVTANGFIGNLSGTADTAGNAGTADSLFYGHGNEINFKGGAPGLCYFNWRNADTDGPSPVDTMQYIFCNYSSDTSKSVIKAGSFDGTTAKASSKMVIPIGAPSSLEDGCIWIER